MKCAFLLFFLLASISPFAQRSAVDDVLSAEKSFAAHAVAHGTKEAFLKFLDSTGVVFEGGKAVNGMAAWNKKPANTGILNWHPVYGFLSSSGDLGFTTGPWTFQPKTVQDSVVARGQFSTVWTKTREGEWKFRVDLGVSNTPVFDDALYSFSAGPVRFVKGTWNNLLNKEQHFINATQQADTMERKKQYEGVVSKIAFFLNRNGALPAVRVDEIGRAVATMPRQVTYSIEGSGISTAGDLGYVYGATKMNGKTENYLRLWRREGKEWKLGLEVLRY